MSNSRENGLDDKRECAQFSLMWKGTLMVSEEIANPLPIEMWDVGSSPTLSANTHTSKSLGMIRCACT